MSSPYDLRPMISPYDFALRSRPIRRRCFSVRFFPPESDFHRDFTNRCAAAARIQRVRTRRPPARSLSAFRFLALAPRVHRARLSGGSTHATLHALACNGPFLHNASSVRSAPSSNRRSVRRRVERCGRTSTSPKLKRAPWARWNQRCSWLRSRTTKSQRCNVGIPTFRITCSDRSPMFSA